MPTYPYSNYPYSKYRQFFEFKRKDYHFKVDIETGKLLFDKKLLALKGAHLPIDLYLKYFQDFYNPYGELTDYTGFPKGFKLNYHVYIFSGYDGYKYIDKDGFVHTFDNAINSMNLFYDTNGTGLMMQINNSGYRVFEDPDGVDNNSDNYSFQQFDSSGRLVKIHEQVSSSKYYEINISYDSDLKISSVTDSYNHSITFDCSVSNQIKIKYNNQVVFVLYMNSSFELVKIEKYTSLIDHFDEELSWNSNGLNTLELATGEAFDIDYTSSKVTVFSVNYKQNYYTLSYYPNDKKTIVHNARDIDTIYQYGQNQLVSQTQDNNVDLGHLSLSKDASSYILKHNIPSGQCLYFNLVAYPFTPLYENVSVSPGCDYSTGSVLCSTLYAKRHYALQAQITGDLGTSTFVIEAYNSSNRLLARLVFNNKTTTLVAPIGLCGSSNITDSFYLRIKNNTSNQVIIINKVRLIPLLGDFSLLCSSQYTHESTFSYGTDSYYFLTEGTSLSFKNGNTTISAPGYNYVKESDYLTNEKLFYKRSGNTFNFWCNDKTLLISNVTEASININASESVLYSVNNDTVVLKNSGTSTPIKFYKISGLEDHSFSATEITHNIDSSAPQGAYRKAIETREICGVQSTVTKYYDKYDRLLTSNRSDGKNINNSYDNDGNLLSETLSVNNQTHQIVNSYTYDSFANQISHQSLVGTSLQTTSYDYDSDNNMSFIHYPNNSHATYSYESVSKDKMVNVAFYLNIYTAISQSIDLDNDVVSEMQVSNSSYSLDYDKGEVSDVYNNNQGIVVYTYYPEVYNGHTLFDRYYTYFSNNYAFVTVYDQMGRLLQDDKLSYEYDDFSNVSEIRDDTVSSLNNNIVFTYDYYDRLTSIYITDNQLRLSNSYDDYGRIESTLFQQNNNTIYSIDSYYYQCQGLEKNVKKSEINYLQNTIKVEDEHDAFARLHTRAVSINNSHGLLYSYSYCNNSSQTNEMVKEVTYLETSNGSPTGSYEKDTYSYDSMGNITAIVRSFSYGQSTFLFGYVYDEFGRLIRENNQMLNRSFVYSYDAIGNITSKQEYYFSLSSLSNPISSRTYNYDLYCKDRIVFFGAEPCTYDNYGNPLFYRDASLSWSRGTLLHTYKKGLTEIEFDYDGFKNRRSKKKYYDDYLLSEITYDYIDGKLLRENRPNNNSILFLYSHTGIVGFVYQNNIYYYEKNIQQDVTGIRDVNNNVVARYVYEAFGKVTVFNYTSTLIGDVNPIRYRSYYYDTDLKLYWLTSRYYDPETGRFISPDDWSYLDYKKINGLNLYAYSKNNPVMYYDPSGHFVLMVSFFAVAISACVFGITIGVCNTVRLSYFDAEERAKASDKSVTGLGTKPDNYEEHSFSDDFVVYYKINEDKNPAKYELIIHESFRYTEEELRIILNWLKYSKGYENINVERMLNEIVWHNVAYDLDELGWFTDRTKSANVYFDYRDPYFFLIFDFLRFW